MKKNNQISVLMSHPSLIMVGLSVMGLLSSCSNLDHDIKYKFDNAMALNATAQSHIEWEASEKHPRSIFTKLRSDFALLKTDEEKQKYRTTLCGQLTALSNHSLAIMEEEIRRDENKSMLNSCLTKLNTALADYSKAQTKGLKYKVDTRSAKPSNIDFKLKTREVVDADLTSLNKFTGSLQTGEVILTFDDGPDKELTDSILRTLDDAGVKVIFFTLGKNVNAMPEIARRQHQQGHVVGSHSMRHFCLDNEKVCETNNKNATGGKVGILSDKEVLIDIESSFKAIKNAIGSVAPFFRFPYGDNRKATSEYLKKRGVFEMHWNIDSNDWRHYQKIGSQVAKYDDSKEKKAQEGLKDIPYTNQDLLKSTLATLDKYKKGIVLFHDVHRRTAEVLPQFLYELYKRDMTVVVLRNKTINTVDIK